MKIEIQNGLPFVSVVLIYRNKNLHLDNVLLDTGSSGTIFPIDRVESIGLQPEPKDEIHRIRGVGGSEYVYQKQIDKLSIGNLNVRNFVIEIGPVDYGFNIQGIIGTDFLIKSKALLDFFHYELSTMENS